MTRRAERSLRFASRFVVRGKPALPVCLIRALSGTSGCQPESAVPLDRIFRVKPLVVGLLLAAGPGGTCVPTRYAEYRSIDVARPIDSPQFNEQIPHRSAGFFPTLIWVKKKRGAYRIGLAVADYAF